MPASAGASNPFAGLSSEQIEHDFREQCIGSMKQQDYAAAIASCTRFTASTVWAGKAHAALAAIYSGPYHPDPDAAYQHAQQAVRLGDPHGKYMSAMLMLQNHTNQTIDLKLAMSWLTDAESLQTYGAAELKKKVEASLACRASRDSFRLLNVPMFCLFDNELGQALTERGLTRWSSYSVDWIETWRPTDVLPIANQAQALFDQGNDGVPQLAAFIYRSEPERFTQLEAALVAKYGAGNTRDSRETKKLARYWTLSQGTLSQSVELSLALVDQAVEVRYSMPDRMRSRAEHLQQQAQIKARVQLRQDASAL